MPYTRHFKPETPAFKPWKPWGFQTSSQGLTFLPPAPGFPLVGEHWGNFEPSCMFLVCLLAGLAVNCCIPFHWYISGNWNGEKKKKKFIPIPYWQVHIPVCTTSYYKVNWISAEVWTKIIVLTIYFLFHKKLHQQSDRVQFTSDQS